MTSPSGTSSVMTFEPPSASLRTGALVVAAFALLSTLALAFIALRTIRLAITVFWQRDDSTSRPPETLFFRTQLGHFAGSLILGNMFISAAGLINFSWTSGLSQGSMCSSQAVLMQIGVWGTCWFTVAHGVHNLTSFVFRMRLSRWHSLVSVTLGWTVAFAAGLAPLQKKNVYGPIGSFCGIMPSFPNEIFALEALPIIVTIIVSIAAYSVIFIVLHRELSLNDTRKLGAPRSAVQRGEDRFEEYHGFIRSIIWTMFWFPLAFVLLLLPFCITHILMYAGSSVPSTLSVFASVCASMSGFVNVCLLFNTLRLIRPVCREPRSADTDKTFGNDASCESPVVSRKSLILSYENGHRMYNPAQLHSYHSRDSSWASADSNTGLLGAEKTSTQAKVTPPLSSRTALPTWVSPQPSHDTLSRLATASRHSPRVSSATRDRQTIDTVKDVKELVFKSKAPPALDLSHLPFAPRPPSGRGVTNKSATLAARLGVPAASARTPSHIATVDQGGARVPAFPVTPIPRVEVNAWGPGGVHESNSEPSPTFSLSLDSDCDSDDLGEIMHIRPVSRVPEPNDCITDPRSTSPQCMQARSQRVTMVSVWSQESAYRTSQGPDAETQEAYQVLFAGLPTPRATQGDQAGMERTTKRQTPVGPRARPTTQFSVRVSQSPRSPDDGDCTIVIAPNDSIV